MKKNPIVVLSLAVAFVAGGMFSVPVHEMMQYPETAKAAVSDTVPEGYTPIYTIDDLYAVRNDLSGNYILMNDIDLSETAPGGDWDCGYGWKPIGGEGEDDFSGVFDGNGYAIKNMHIYGEPDEEYVGLFGRYGYNSYSHSYGTITRLALLDCDIDIVFDPASYHYIGGIAGSCGKVSECYVTGNIKTSSQSSGNHFNTVYIGGICGSSSTSSGSNVRNIINCYNACDISITLEDGESPENYELYSFEIGGIAGYCYDSQCNYNVGTISITKGDQVNSDQMVGYITGDDATLQSCFYLKTDAGYTASGKKSDNSYTNVVGLTKGQMKSSAAYTGFDFDEVWTIDPSADYPYPTLRNVPYVSASEEQPTTDPTTEAPTYDPTEPGSNPSSGSPQKGDINEDGFVNAVDASIILIYSTNIGVGNYVSIDDLY